MRVTRLAARPLRSLESAEAGLGEGITAVVGENGTGKTNLLEALYFALTGRSFRTGDRRDLIPFGAPVARAEAWVTDENGAESRFLAAVSRPEGRRHLLDGSPVDPLTASRRRPPVAVFSPDRLTLVKGPPAERRAHVDRFVAVRWPSREELRQRYGRALAQRNAQIGRIAAGVAPPSGLDPWDAALAEAAAPLVQARREATEELAAPFTAAAADLGLEGEAHLQYSPRAAGDAEDLRAALAERRESDLRLGRSGWGPHLDEVRIDLEGHPVRRFGSQGQQRIALLALLFAERQALIASGRPSPLMLLDDVMSEIDPTRRELLVQRLAGGGQALITAADPASIPDADATLRMPGALSGLAAAA
jgi:DNA replication and repair protein RecF